MNLEIESHKLESLLDDAKRWRYVRDNLLQCSSPHMNGNFAWRFRSLHPCTGRTIDEVIDANMELNGGGSDANEKCES